MVNVDSADHNPTGDAGSSGDRAVVIGASIAGLLAARVLADHFDEVVVVERDHLPAGPEFRKGVPQSRHLHVLLAGGRTVVEELQPGVEAELIAAGAVPAEMPRDALWLAAAGWGERFEGGLSLLSSSRELLEWTIRRRLGAHPNIGFRHEHEVVGLLATSDRGAVAGVRLRSRGGPRSAGTRPPIPGEERSSSPEDWGGGETDLAAALVVDASGRNSRTPRWLAELGYPAVQETTIDAFLGYASRQFAIPPENSADWKIIFLQAKAPDSPRSGYLFPIEGNRWFVSLMGAARDYPPTDEAGFLAYARGLRSPVLAEAIADAEPLTPIFGHRSTENRLRHYDRLPRRPERFLVVGDAACAVNPVYGQGMTVAAKSALTLDRCLREQGDDPTGLAERFQRELARTAESAWLIATGEDLRYPTTEGATPDLRTRLTHRYLDRVIAAATNDPRVSRAFLEVLNLNAPPTSLFRPGVLIPVLRNRGPSAATAPPRRVARADEGEALAREVA